MRIKASLDNRCSLYHAMSSVSSHLQRKKDHLEHVQRCLAVVVCLQQRNRNSQYVVLDCNRNVAALPVCMMTKRLQQHAATEVDVVVVER